jgi:hypothetical protein
LTLLIGEQTGERGREGFLFENGHGLSEYGNLGSRTAPDFFDRMDRMGGTEELIGIAATNAPHLPAEC